MQRPVFVRFALSPGHTPSPFTVRAHILNYLTDKEVGSNVRSIWRLHKMGGCVSHHLRVVYLAGSVRSWLLIQTGGGIRSRGTSQSSCQHGLSAAPPLFLGASSNMSCSPPSFCPCLHICPYLHFALTSICYDLLSCRFGRVRCTYGFCRDYLQFLGLTMRHG